MSTPVSDPKIMIDSPESATYRTVTGWVSKDGYFYGSDESAARRAGATHVYCQDCESPIPKKGFVICDACLASREQARFEAKPKADWDGEALIYSEVLDEFFHSPEEAYEAAMDEQGDELPTPTASSLRLVIGEPQYLRELELEDFESSLPSDAHERDTAPDWIIQAIERFNQSMKGKPPTAWAPGKYALAD